MYIFFNSVQKKNYPYLSVQPIDLRLENILVCCTIQVYSLKSFLLWKVDTYVRNEGTSLHFIEQKQRNVRSEVYKIITHYLGFNCSTNTVSTKNIVFLSCKQLLVFVYVISSIHLYFPSIFKHSFLEDLGILIINKNC